MLTAFIIMLHLFGDPLNNHLFMLLLRYLSDTITKYLKHMYILHSINTPKLKPSNQGVLVWMYLGIPPAKPY